MSAPSIPPHSQNFRSAAGEEPPRDRTSLRMMLVLIVLAWCSARGVYELGRDFLAWMGS